MNRRTFIKAAGSTLLLPTFIEAKPKSQWICLQDKLPKIGQKVVLLSYGTSSYLVNINWLVIEISEIVPRNEIVKVNSTGYAKTPLKYQKQHLPYKSQLAYEEDVYDNPSVVVMDTVPIEYIKSIKWIKEHAEVWAYRKPYTLLAGETLIHSNAFWIPQPKNLNDIYPLPEKETRPEKLYHKK